MKKPKCGFCGRTMISDGTYYYCSCRENTEPINDLSDNWAFADNLTDEIDRKLAIEKLPKRQRVIAELAFQGYNQSEIAKMLDLSQKTISNKLKEITKKLNFLL